MFVNENHLSIRILIHEITHSPPLPERTATARTAWALNQRGLSRTPSRRPSLLDVEARPELFNYSAMGAAQEKRLTLE
jgi:hypothetical protein